MPFTKKAIETFSVNAVRDSIMMTDLLDQFIPDNDKEPFWDGAVYIYKDKNHKKDAFYGRVPVQVKGTENNDLSKDEISYPVKTVDLRGYLADGGVIFFVVYVGTLGKRIYYTELTPIKIRMILEEAKTQGQKSIKLKSFPNDNDAKISIFMNCYQHCQKQSSFSYATLYSLEELQKQGILENITIPLSGIGIKKDPQKALLQSDVYIYANIKGSSIPQPIPIIPKDLQTTETVDSSVVINGKVYYDSVRIIKTATSTKYIFGESFSITTVDGKEGVDVKYKSSDNVRIISKDLDFMLALLDAEHFEYNGHKFYLPADAADYSNFDIDMQRDLLSFAQKATTILNTMNCKKSLSMDSMQDEDIRNLSRLYSCIIENKVATRLRDDLPPICKMKVGNLNFIISLTQQEECNTSYEIKDFFNSEVLLTYQGRDENRYPLSQYALLSAGDLLNADNINWQVLLPSFKKVEKHKETMERANYFLLNLLSAYDKSQNKEILEVAKDFSDWIMTATEEELPLTIRKLNELQIIKRMRPFSPEETQSLYQIIFENSTDDAILVGAYLLLDQQSSAETHFSKLSGEMQKEFTGYPIYHFWNK